MAKEIVTCCIPCHNGVSTIERAVKSAIEAGVDFVLVYDDASTDGTKETLEHLSKQYVELEFYSTLYMVRAGVNYARNYLCEIADHGLIISLDCDDTLNDIAPLVEAWEKGTWVYGKHDEIIDDKLIGTVKASPPGSLARKELTGITFMMHRDDWKKVGGFDPDFGYCEDYGMQCNLASHGVQPKYVDTVVYNRYVKPEGNERSVLAGLYWSFYRDMARRKYGNVFAGVG